MNAGFIVSEESKLNNFRKMIIKASSISEKYLSMLAASLLFTCILFNLLQLEMIF